MESVDAPNGNIDSVPALYFHLADIFNRGITSPLHLFVTYAHTTIERLSYNANRKDRSIGIDQLGDNIYEIKLRNRKRSSSGWLVTKKEVWLFYIHSEESPLAGSIAEDWISGMIPFVSHARIPPNSLFDLIDSLVLVSKGHLVIEDYLAHSYRHTIRERHEGQKNWASQKGWTGEVYNRARLERNISATKSLLHAIKIEFPNDKTSFVARISRIYI